MTIGEKIKQARIQAGMTQKQLADKCGMADSAIRKYESGRVAPKMGTVKKISAALNVSIRELLKGTPWGDAQDTMERIANAREVTIERLDMKTGEIVRTTEITPLYKRMETAFSKLNTEGKRVAIERIEELTQLPQYQRQTKAPETPPGSADDKESKAK